MKLLKKVLCLLLLLSLLPLPALGEEALQVETLSVEGGVVRFTTSRPITACCFTRVEVEPALDSPDWIEREGSSFSYFKYDGEYYLWLRDAHDNISSPYPFTVVSGYHYYIDAEGLSPLYTPAQEVLDIDDANAYIYEQVVQAGLYTREGVLSAGAAVLSYLGERGYALPYQSGGTFQEEEDWGIDPQSGSKLSQPISDSNGTYRYRGMHCVAAIVWTYKLAGINLSNTQCNWRIFELGASVREGDNQISYNKAIGGDLAFTGTHTLMIFDRLDKDGDGMDDTYLCYEMRSPTLLIMERSIEGMRYLPIYSMETVFQNQSQFVRYARFWPDTLFIPEETFPELLQQAIAQSEQKKAAQHFLKEMGMKS